MHRPISVLLYLSLISSLSAPALADEVVGRLDYALPQASTGNKQSDTTQSTGDAPAGAPLPKIDAPPALPVVKAHPFSRNFNEPTPVSADRPDLLTPLLSELDEDNDLLNRIRGGFGMGELDSDLVKRQEAYYANRPEYVKRIVDRGSRYLYYIVSEVERRGMPTEIALLPMIESAFNPRAESPAAASGIWQFIPSTGKRYGLERTWWYDGRRDVVAATGAALDYLQTLHDMFGDWQLALAAYNWGEGSVSRALAKARKAGIENPNYSNIRMPDETRNYVPKLMAVRNILANPAQFGLDLKPVPNKPYFQTVDVGKHIDIKVAAKLAEVSTSELLHLNPAFKRPVFAAKGSRKLVLPADKVDTFKKNLVSYDQPLLNWQPYVPRRGEKLPDIADRFGISLAELKEVNELGNKDATVRGQTLLVPIVSGVDISDRQTVHAMTSEAQQPPEEKASEKRSSTSKTHTTAKGDTLASIARKYRLSVADLQKWNQLKNAKLKLGQKLQLEPSSKSDARGKQAEKSDKLNANDKRNKRGLQKHEVRKGDTLGSLARQYGVTEDSIRRANNLKLKPNIKPGMRLNIPQ